jgi:hypothetical protein
MGAILQLSPHGEIASPGRNHNAVRCVPVNEILPWTELCLRRCWGWGQNTCWYAVPSPPWASLKFAEPCHPRELIERTKSGLHVGYAPFRRSAGMTAICANRTNQLIRRRDAGTSGLLSFRCGPYRLPRLFAERLLSTGAARRQIRTSLHDLTERFSYDCLWRAEARSKKGKSVCGVYLPDLERRRPPDLPPRMVKLRLVKGD